MAASARWRAVRRRAALHSVGSSVWSGRATPAVSLTRWTQRADHPVVVVAALAQVEPSVAQPALDLLEPLGAEQLLEQPVPVLGASAQERLEAALGEHRDLGELGEVHARPARSTR